MTGRGNRLTAILVHGAGGGGWQWAIWAEVFTSEGIAVLAPDLRPSRAGLEATTWSDYLRQLQGWRAAGGVGRQVLVGASLGGLLALASAAAIPPAALVLVNPVPPQGIRPWPPLRARPPRVAWSKLPFAATRAAMPDAELAAARHAHTRWRDESGRVLNEVASGLRIEPPSCPVLVLAAAEDSDIPPATSRATADWLGGEFVEIPGCSHVGVLLGHRAADAASRVACWLAGEQAGNCD
jgi:pimeloyl-ACP methyl ester carboxylesterase